MAAASCSAGPVRVSPGGSSGRSATLRRYAEQHNHIVQWSEFDRGATSPPWKPPWLPVGDVRAFFRRFR